MSNNQKKDEIQGEIENIQSTLDNLTVAPQDPNADLKNQVGSIRKEQLELDTLITETRLIVGKVEKDIEQNQGEIDSLNEDLRIIIKEMQKRNNESNIKLFFSSRSLGEMLSEIAKISSLQPDLETKKQQIQVT